MAIVDEAGNEELVQAGDVVHVQKRGTQPEYMPAYWVSFDADWPDCVSHAILKAFFRSSRFPSR